MLRIFKIQGILIIVSILIAAKEIDRFVDIVRELKGMQKDTKLVFGEKY